MSIVVVVVVVAHGRTTIVGTVDEKAPLPIQFVFQLLFGFRVRIAASVLPRIIVVIVTATAGVAMTVGVHFRLSVSPLFFNLTVFTGVYDTDYKI